MVDETEEVTTLPKHQASQDLKPEKAKKKCKDKFKERYGEVFSNLKFLKTTEKPPTFVPLECKIEPDEFENEELLEKLKVSPVELVSHTQNHVFGNYDRYYSYRYDERWQDPRLKLLSKEYFLNKDVLDIGCNDGSFTIMLAIKFFPKKIVGLDIDYKLINKAIHNVKYFEKQQKITHGPKKPEDMEKEEEERKRKRVQELMEKLKSLPKSFAINMGVPISIENGETQKQTKESDNSQSMKNEEEEKHTEKLKILNRFPDNVSFRVENFIKDMSTPEKYDTVTCFSTSKWIHLNYGDCGIKRLFKKVHDSLKEKGVFIFEPQDWRSYKKRKYLTEEFKKNYQGIQLKPKYFQNYLVQRLGFTLIWKFDPEIKDPKKPGFKRPIYIYQKD